jgi:hypothetical protein
VNKEANKDRIKKYTNQEGTKESGEGKKKDQMRMGQKQCYRIVKQKNTSI